MAISCSQSQGAEGVKMLVYLAGVVVMGKKMKRDTQISHSELLENRGYLNARLVITENRAATQGKHLSKETPA